MSFALAHAGTNHEICVYIIQHSFSWLFVLFHAWVYVSVMVQKHVHSIVEARIAGTKCRMSLALAHAGAKCNMFMKCNKAQLQLVCPVSCMGSMCL